MFSVHANIYLGVVHSSALALCTPIIIYYIGIICSRGSRFMCVFSPYTPEALWK